MISMLRIRFREQLCRSISTSRNLNGYIVLVPEIGEDSNVINALIKPDGLPHFNGLTIENCLAAVAKQASLLEETVRDVETSIEAAENVDLEKDVFGRFESITNALETTWGIAKTLYFGNSTLMPTRSYMNIHNRARAARASKFNSEVIYQMLKKSSDDGLLSGKEQSRVAEKYLLEGKLNGLDLSHSQREQLKEILTSLGNERSSFGNKVIAAKRQFVHQIFNFSLVRDFPANFLESIATDTSNPTKGPWKITLQPKIVSEFLKYCPSRSERWNIWQADVRKASQFQDKSLETSTHIENIRSLRKRQAQILGFPNYTAMSMQTKMAKSAANVKDMLTNLLKYAGPAQAKEIINLQEFATKSGFSNTLDIYDIPYWNRKLLKTEYNLDEEIIKEYFPLPHVLKQLFKLAERLFQIEFVERKNVEVWHPTVEYLDILENGTPIGGIYLDCYSKEGLFNERAAWMVGIRNKSATIEATPLSSFIFNLNSPVYGKPCLLSMSDLELLFRTLGTGLQHLLTKAKYSDLAGLSNIEWDASQVCGQVLISFLDNPNVLKEISCHYSSNEQIPDDILQNIRMIKKSMAGHKLCNEMYLADLDLQLYSSDDFWLDVVKRLWPVYMHIPLDKRNLHVCSMEDIFAGDWGAALYSHLYSKLIAADIYAAFLENPNDEEGVGKRFKDSFLAFGGSMRTEEIFRIFRGRDPSPNAFLESYNLLDATSEF